MQILQVIGNLGADAKVVAQDGRSFISFNVADTERWKDENGQDHERTSWISCAYNGDATAPILPYLKAGTKVFVQGRQRTRVYSSEKERRMVAGVNLSVTHIELVGGSSDDVPRRLINPETAELIDTHKAFFIDYHDVAKLPAAKCLVDKTGKRYQVDAYNFIHPESVQLPPVTDQAQQSQEQTQQQPQQDDGAPFTGDDSPETIAVTKPKGKKK